MSRRDSSEAPDNQGLSKVAAWRQLLRLANVFTALSNVLAGALIAQETWQPTTPLALLLASSALLYCAGMVLNDVFDAELDAKERPERPIPSGRISREEAALVGWSLLATGVGAAAWASYLLASIAPIILGASLAVTIVMYDGGLKSMWAGPLAMGWCRTLNVLLGASLAGTAVDGPAWLYAGVVGLYTIGLTYLARDEATTSSAGGIRTAGLLLLAAFGLFFAFSFSVTLAVPDLVWFVAWGSAIELAGLAFFTAARQPSPKRVQLGVKRLILLFIVIDAVACLAVGGWKPAGLVLSLLVPTLQLSRKTAMT
ncbi:MAG: UbiA family prenyltransferase [Lacipirellulaceae bacterium]